MPVTMVTQVQFQEKSESLINPIHLITDEITDPFLSRSKDFTKNKMASSSELPSKVRKSDQKQLAGPAHRRLRPRRLHPPGLHQAQAHRGRRTLAPIRLLLQGAGLSLVLRPRLRPAGLSEVLLTWTQHLCTGQLDHTDLGGGATG